MPQEMMHQEAIKLAVENAKKLMCFYQKAADMVEHPGGKKVFMRLAGEKKDHVSRFFRYYRGTEFGTLDEFISTPCREEGAVMKELGGIINADVKERRAREIALAKELESANLLRGKASKIVDPGVRVIFDQMAEESQKHYMIIESEYARYMRMPHETDIDTFVRE